MQAYLAQSPSGPSGLALTEYPNPVPGPQEVLIDVKAAGLNRADLLQSMGRYAVPPGATPVLGLEAAGMVVAVGNQVQHIHPGDRVAALLTGGAFADQVVAHAGSVIALPATSSFTEGTAIPEAYLTAFQALHTLANLQKGETVLVHAGASGVGSAAIQLAHLAGARVIATAGAATKTAYCLNLGADLAINYKETDFSEAVNTFTEGKGVQVILDFIGADYWQKNLKSAAIDARWVLLGLMGGNKIADADIGTFLYKRIHLLGSTLRSRSDAYKATLVQDFSSHYGNNLHIGTLRPQLDRVFGKNELADAMTYMAENKNLGKIVIDWTR